jgi:hypothetical protein
MKNFLILLSFFLVFTTNVFSQCTSNTWGQYGNLSPVCGNGVNGNWSTITWAYSQEYSIVNVVAGNTYEFQSYVTSGGANRFTTITTTFNVNSALAWGTTNTAASVTWTATFTGQVIFWTHLNTSCGSSTVNQTRRVRCSVPPCVGTSITLTLDDSWGDGWNGGQITINGSSGSTYGPYTLTNGFTGSNNICLPDDCYSVNVTSGLYPWEISWSITNGATLLANGGAPVTLNDAFSTGSANCTPPVPGPCTNTVPYLGSNLPTQFNPLVQSLCGGIDPPFGQFTDEYTEWTNGVAGTDYIVTSSVSSDWITITSVTPNGAVVAFGSSPLVWTAPSNGTYFIHVSSNGFCGEDNLCRDITVERLSALPVTLISFTMECDKGIPVLKWTTESEQNSDYFQIERSRDGFDWIEVSKVQAMGNSNTIKNYQFYDMTSGYFEGYYRLKQVDFDGKFEYFGPVSSFCSDHKNELISEVFPNPTTGEVSLGIRNDIQETVNVSVSDYTGRILYEMSIEINEGYTLKTIDLSKYITGTYLICITTNNTKYIHKVIKK